MIVVVLSAVSFLLGVVLATLTGWVISPFVLLGAVALLWFRPRWGAVLLAFLLGFARFELWQQRVLPPISKEPVTVVGTLDLDWGKKDGKWTWVVATEEGQLLLRTSAYQELEYGETVELKGLVMRSADFSDKDSYLHYLERYEVWRVMDGGFVKVLAPPKLSLWSALSWLSDRLTHRLQVLLPEPDSSLAVGLLLGKRQAMDAELQQAFQTVGLTHIVAISGSNIAMVVVAFFALFGFLPFRKRLVWSGVGVALFVLLVGPTAAVLRAGLMGILSLAGLYSGRKSQAFFGLLWSAVLMVLWNPLVLTYDVGFQLSFASTLGILTLTPVLQKIISSRCPAREAVTLTLAAQIMTFPFIVFHFGRFSWITLAANLLVAPLIPLAMIFSGLALVFGPPAAALASVFLLLIEKVAIVCAAIPGASVELSISAPVFVGLLLALAIFLLLFYKSKLARAFLRADVGVPSME